MPSQQRHCRPICIAGRESAELAGGHVSDVVEVESEQRSEPQQPLVTGPTSALRSRGKPPRNNTRMTPLEVAPTVAAALYKQPTGPQGG